MWCMELGQNQREVMRLTQFDNGLPVLWLSESGCQKGWSNKGINYVCSLKPLVNAPVTELVRQDIQHR